MRPIPYWLFSLACILSLSACAPVFETQADVQARQALRDLAEVQEAFYRDNQRYAKNLREVEKYPLNYHKGTVYMEIQFARKDKYRAISLPAESTTARVFAYDTDKGGFYEMDEEVPQYVLGALDQIRKKQREENLTEAFSIVLAGLLLALGIRSLVQTGAGNFRMVYLSFFASLYPLSWTMAVLQHMRKETVLSPLIQGGIISSLAFAGFCLIACGLGISNYLKEKGPTSLAGIFCSTITISLFSAGVMVYTLVEY